MTSPLSHSIPAPIYLSSSSTPRPVTENELPFFDTFPLSPRQQPSLFPLSETFENERDLINFLIFMDVPPDLLLSVSGQLPLPEKAAAFRALVDLASTFLTEKKQKGSLTEQQQLLEETLRALSEPRNGSAFGEDLPPDSEVVVLSEKFKTLFLKSFPHIPQCSNFFHCINRFYGNTEISPFLVLLLKKNSPRSDAKVRKASTCLLPSYPKHPKSQDPIHTQTIIDLKRIFQKDSLSKKNPHILILSLRILAGTLTMGQRISASRVFDLLFKRFIETIFDSDFETARLSSGSNSLFSYRKIETAITRLPPQNPSPEEKLRNYEGYYKPIWNMIEQYFLDKETETERIISFFIWLIEQTLPKTSQAPSLQQYEPTTPAPQIPAPSSSLERATTIDPNAEGAPHLQHNTSSSSSSSNKQTMNEPLPFTFLISETCPLSVSLPAHTPGYEKGLEHALLTRLGAKAPLEKQQILEEQIPSLSCEFLSILSELQQNSAISSHSSSSITFDSRDEEIPQEVKLLSFLTLHEDLSPLSLSALSGNLAPVMKTAAVQAAALVILMIPPKEFDLSKDPELAALHEMITKWAQTNPLINPLQEQNIDPMTLLASALFKPMPKREDAKEELSESFYKKFSGPNGLFERMKRFYSYYEITSPDPFLTALRILFLRNKS